MCGQKELFANYKRLNRRQLMWRVTEASVALNAIRFGLDEVLPAVGRGKTRGMLLGAFISWGR